MKTEVSSKLGSNSARQVIELRFWCSFGRRLMPFNLFSKVY